MVDIGAAQIRVPSPCSCGCTGTSCLYVSNTIQVLVGMQMTGDLRQCHLSVQQVQALPKRLHGGRGSLQWRPRGPGRGNSLSIVSMAHNTTWDAPRGLVDPANDKDACGVGFIGELNKVPTRSCVVNALEMLLRMTHRGACGCEVNSGWPHFSTCCKDIEWDICRYFKLRKAHQLISCQKRIVCFAAVRYQAFVVP
jgi:hypothetical protein